MNCLHCLFQPTEGKSGAFVPLLTGAASAPWRPSLAQQGSAYGQVVGDLEKGLFPQYGWEGKGRVGWGGGSVGV